MLLIVLLQPEAVSTADIMVGNGAELMTASSVRLGKSDSTNHVLLISRCVTFAAILKNSPVDCVQG